MSWLSASWPGAFTGQRQFCCDHGRCGHGHTDFPFRYDRLHAGRPGPQSYNGFTVNAGRGVATIAIDAGNNTLAGVRDAINEADIGVKAAIVNDGSGYRLLLSSAQTGAANSPEITVDDTGDGNHVDAAGLSALAFNSGAANMGQTVAAQDALFSINGLRYQQRGKPGQNAIDGVTITLKGTDRDSAGDTDHRRESRQCKDCHKQSYRWLQQL